MSPLITRLLACAVIALATGCATLFPATVNLGDTEAELIAKRGNPTGRYVDGDKQILEYAYGPGAQTTYMARLNKDGLVESFEQVLTQEKFAEIEIGKTTRNDVLLKFGRPEETSYLRLKDYEVWTYSFTGSGVWDSLMHVHFDRNGAVQLMVRQWDPRYHQPVFLAP